MSIKRNNIIFIICIFIIALSTIFISFNINKIIPTYKNQKISKEIKKDISVIDVSIQEKVQKESVENFTYFYKNSNEIDQEDEFLQQCIKAFDLQEYKITQNVYSTKEERDEKNYHYIVFDKVNEEGKFVQLIFMYKKDYSKVYFFSSAGHYTMLEYQDVEMDKELRRTIIEEGTEIVQKTNISVLDGFEPNIIWKMTKYTYVLKDSKRNITVYYNYSDKQIIGFMYEEI